VRCVAKHCSQRHGYALTYVARIVFCVRFVPTGSSARFAPKPAMRIWAAAGLDVRGATLPHCKRDGRCNCMDAREVIKASILECGRKLWQPGKCSLSARI
jgi:hypothetical protein